MQHYYGGNEILIFLIEVVLAGPPSPLTKYLKDCFKSSRIPGSFGQVIHLPIPDKLVGFHQLLLEPFHINIDENLCMYVPPYQSLLHIAIRSLHTIPNSIVHTQTYPYHSSALHTPFTPLRHFQTQLGWWQELYWATPKILYYYMDCQIFLCFCAKTWH